MNCLRLLICFSVWIPAWTGLLGEDALPEIRPEQARQYVGQKVRVTLEVRGAKHSLHRKTTFLDSERDFRDEKNLGIAISEQGVEALGQSLGFTDAVTFFLGKSIQVSGTIELQEGRPYLPVDAVEQIQVVDPALQ